MAFCSKCGNHLEGNERFCVKCGADLAATPPAATPPAAPSPAIAAPVAQYAAPAGYPVPGGIAVPMPAAVPAKRLPWVWIAITLVLAGVAFYYYHKEQTLVALIQNAINNSNSNGGGTTNNGGGGNNNGGGAGGGGNNLAAVMQQQVWHQTAWQVTNGAVIVQGTWENNGTTSIANGTLTCTEYDANTQQLGTLTTTLYGPSNGPILGGNTYTYNSINMGAATSSALNRLGCSLTNVSL